MELTRRHTLHMALGALAAGQGVPAAGAGATPSGETEKSVQVNIILMPEAVQLDLTGPFEVLSRTPGWTIDLVAASMDAVRTDHGLLLTPMATRETAKPSDILVVPGGEAVDEAMLDPDWLAYVARESERARFVFGVCAGSLLLAACGALTGRRAGSHWQSRDLLALFGVIPSDERLTVDGKFYTTAGITAGIDMAFRVVADFAGEETARKILLAMEYDPAPPFSGGRPDNAPPQIVSAVLADSRLRRARREEAVARAAARLREAGARRQSSR
jgi:cyclohexyl-isocyanide hydratase